MARRDKRETDETTEVSEEVQAKQVSPNEVDTQEAKEPEQKQKASDGKQSGKVSAEPEEEKSPIQIFDRPPQTEEESDSQEEPKEPLNDAQLKEKLAKELGISAVVDNEGNRILPSTPIMRMMHRQRNKPVPVQTQTIEEIVVKQYGEQILENKSVQYVIATLGEYTKGMSPNTVTTEDNGARYQQSLAHMFDVILSLDGENCQICLDITISVMRENINLCFNDRLSHRFANVMTIAQQDAIRFQTLLTTFIELARGTTKKDLPKKVSIHKLLDLITNRNAKANLAEYLN